MNKRKDFRVKMFDQVCTVFNSKHTTSGKMLNVSGSGAAVEIMYDYFVDKIELEFNIQGKDFKRSANVLRKNETADGYVIYYVSFTGFDEKERERLHSELLSVEAKRLNQHD